jgi:hypothetical protein
MLLPAPNAAAGAEVEMFGSGKGNDPSPNLSLMPTQQHRTKSANLTGT